VVAVFLFGCTHCLKVGIDFIDFLELVVGVVQCSMTGN